jgi:hypothetical protein
MPVITGTSNEVPEIDTFPRANPIEVIALSVRTIPSDLAFPDTLHASTVPSLSSPAHRGGARG